MSRYYESHISPNGPGDDRPTALQIIQDEDLSGKLSDKVIVITGCSSGIGVETARALATTGPTLILTARDTDKASSALSDLLSGVRAGALSILSKTQKINILINNAGVMAIPTLTLTADGYEMQFATNHLLHFLLFQLLLPTLLASIGKEWEGKGGVYLDKCRAAPPASEAANEYDRGYQPYIYDEVAEKRLWGDSLKMVGMEEDE